jgi:hypothetical protein
MSKTEVRGSQIKDATIMNADVATDAAIAISKVALASTLTDKTPPVDADLLIIGDSAASGVWKKLTWANLKSTLGAGLSKAIGSEVDTGTDDTKYVTVKAINDSHNVPLIAPGSDGNFMTSNGTDWISEAITVPVKAAGSDITTGTDDTKFATAKALDDALISPKKLQGGNIWYAADAGANDTYVITLSPVPAAYTTGMVIHFKANTVNTGAATLNANTLGAKTIKKSYNLDLEDGDIKAGQDVLVMYDGTNFQLLSPTAKYRFRTTHTWTVYGEIKVPSGDTDFIPGMNISIPTNATASIVKCRYKINSGTSVTAKLQKNAGDITGFTSISVTTTAASTDPTDVALADDDRITLVVTAVSATPKNMEFTIYIDWTI